MKFNFKINTTSIHIFIVAVIVLILRIVIIDAYSNIAKSFNNLFYDTLISIVSNYWLLLPMVALNIGGLMLINKFTFYGKKLISKLFFQLLLVLTLSAIATFIIIYTERINSNLSDYRAEIIVVVFTSVIINTVVIFVGDIVRYQILTRQMLREERTKHHKTQHQYNQLKQQLNPHFLFNSLNILNVLVQEKETKRASAFINKLANIYRYLLATETQKTVSLNDEIAFLNMYIDLLAERFSDGLNVDVSVSINSLKLHIIPCGIQVLVENAIQHNIVTKSDPLNIEIFDTPQYIVVKNNIQPRISTSPSTGLGLKNISGQYKDIASKEIVIEKTETAFIVKLPLLFVTN